MILRFSAEGNKIIKIDEKEPRKPSDWWLPWAEVAKQRQ